MTEPVSCQSVGLSPAAQIIPLRGFSGCRVVFVHDEHGAYVRKLARDMDYNARLLRQAEKQEAFRGDGRFQPVAVRAYGRLESGIAYIDMDYVPGVTAAETLEVLPLAEIQRWVAILLHFSERPAQGMLAPAVFHGKLAELGAQLEARALMTPPAAQTLARLRSRAWDGIPHSPCHGDLTLENIIVHDGKLYLIDFLDGFADSWYLDIAKLLQDLAGGWSFRRQHMDRNLILRLASLRHSLETVLEARHPGCIAPIRDLYALNLLRILPYASAPEDRAFVDSRLAAALTNHP